MSEPYRVLYGTSNDDEWLKLRQRGIGASEAAVILGISKWGTPRSIWQAKRAETVVDVGNDVMEFGHLAEEVIHQFLIGHPERYGWMGELLPSEGLLQSVEWPWLLGTLDARVRTPDGTVVPLEKKSVNDHSAREWLDLADGDPDDPFGTTMSRYVVPPKYQVQVQQQMAVTGAPFAFVAVWLGKERIEVIRVERDEAFIQRYLVGELGQFWHEHVQTGIPPAPNPRDNLWDIWPGTQGEEVVADGDLLDLLGRWRLASVDLRDAKTDRDDLSFQIAVTMGDAEAAVHPVTGQKVHTLKGQRNSRTTDLKKLESEFPDAYAACVREGTWSRRHRPTREAIDVD